MADTRKKSEKAFDLFLEAYNTKHPKAAQWLEEAREELLVFDDISADVYFGRHREILSKRDQIKSKNMALRKTQNLKIRVT